jgi:hypothetical protein
VVSPARAYEAVEGWLFEPRPIHALVAGRIVFGGILFLCYLVRLPDAGLLYGANGLSGPDFIQQLVPSGTIFQAIYELLSGAVGVQASAPGPVLLALLYATLLACALSFALGFRTRTTGWIVWLIHLYFYKLRLPMAYWGWPALMQGFMLYVLLSRAGDFFSLDAWLARRRDGGEAPPVSAWVAPAWPLRLLQVHLCAMYATVGWSRIESTGWLAGETVFTAVTTALHSRLVIDWAPFKPLLQLATWFVFVLEPAAVFLLWLPRIGAFVAYSLIAMHMGLEALTNVGWWGFAVLPGLLAFLPRHHVEALFRRLTRSPRPDSSTL